MDSEEISKQLKAALEECARLREENKRLRALLGVHEQRPKAVPAVGLSPEDKIALFRKGNLLVLHRRVRFESLVHASGY